MKLRNKKTGKIEEFEDITRVFKFIGNQNTYNSLAEFIDEWEDVPKEPKEEWYINCIGEVLENNKAYCHTVTPEKLQSIGNYFETKEEAEQAVKKLKAWKRLKDKGFRFTNWNCSLGEIYFKVPDTFFDTPDTLGETISEETSKILDFLFRGEE